MFNTSFLHGRASALLLSMTLAIPGCKDEDDDPGTGDTDDMGVCPDCEPGQEAYLCIIGGEEHLICFDDLAAAQASCSAMPGNGVVGNAPAPCENQDAGPSIDWDPGAFVAYDEASRTYDVDQQFLAEVLDDPRMLLHDRARLEWRGDHFEFEDIAKGDLVDLLGFINGDALVEINGYPLSTMREVGEAFDALRKQSSFTVAVIRDEGTIMLEYRVVDDA